MAGSIDDGKLNSREELLRTREEELLAMEAKLDALEKSLKAREKELTARDSRRKQIILRLPESLWRDIAEWAEYDVRSVNGQIEYILTRSVREHRQPENKSGEKES